MANLSEKRNLCAEEMDYVVSININFINFFKKRGTMKNNCV